ncbi:MAG: hypothetical protein R3F08_09715 [Dokdonella sp.]
MATLAWPASDALAGLCAPDTSAPLFQDGFDPDAFGGTPDYYLPEQPLFIHWDAPRLVHVGIDIDYPLTGYDWLNRPLSWHVLEGPPGMSIDAKGRLSWVPNTQGDVCVRIEMRAGADRVQSAFTIAVADARCVFVDGSAPAGGDGSLAAPFQTLLDALGTVQDGVGRTVYLRGGLDYRIENVSWYAMPSGNPYRRVAQGSWEEADPLLIRSFPGEAVRYTFVDGSGFVLGKRVVLIGVELVGGNAGEMAALLMNAGSVAKYVVARDYSCNAQNNCTGVKFHGGCLLDHVEAYDNFDRSNLTYHNSSNFLFYATIGLPERADAFAIDCISSGFSVLGFKIKHAGSAGRMHLHRCVSYGTRNPFARSEQSKQRAPLPALFGPRCKHQWFLCPRTGMHRSQYRRRSQSRRGHAGRTQSGGRIRPRLGGPGPGGLRLRRRLRLPGPLCRQPRDRQRQCGVRLQLYNVSLCESAVPVDGNVSRQPVHDTERNRLHPTAGTSSRPASSI